MGDHISHLLHLDQCRIVLSVPGTVPYRLQGRRQNSFQNQSKKTYLIIVYTKNMEDGHRFILVCDSDCATTKNMEEEKVYKNLAKQLS